jgi:hypothetical protein
LRREANWCSISLTGRAARPLALGEYDRLMAEDFDHEVIDSPQALLQHLYEVHGVEEALGLDPATAPLQFWVRRHAELERAARGEAARPPEPPRPTAPEPRTGAGGMPRPPAPDPRPPAPDPRPAASGPRYRPFADPLVEALVGALVRRGLEERAVRRWIASYSDGRRGGEEAVRAGFLAPLIEALAAHVRGEGGRAPAPAPPPPPPRASAPAPEPPPRSAEVDYMAIADVLQSRRSRAGRGRREPPAAPRVREPADDHDDDMALANALQRRRGRRARR